MADQTLYPYERAVELGVPFWRVEVTNWGNRQTGAVPTSLRYPATTQLRNGAAHIALGPDSTADQVIVDYFQGEPTVVVAPTPGVLDTNSITVGIQHPGQSLLGPMNFRTAPSTMFGDAYVMDDGLGTTAQFGTSTVFEAPRLQLFVFPYQPRQLPPLRRNNMFRSVRVDSASGTTEVQLGIWPVMGRLAKSVAFRATGTLAGSARVGLISSQVIGTSGVPIFNVVETTEFSAGVAGATAEQVRKTITTPTQWLVAYFTRSGGAGSIICNLLASDDACTDSAVAAP